MNARFDGISSPLDAARLPGWVDVPGVARSSEFEGPEVATSEAVAVGAVMVSIEPKLERLTGLVRASFVEVSEVVMDFATLASGSLIVVAAAGASLALLIPETAPPNSALIAVVAGFGLIWRESSRACCSRRRRSSAIAAAPVSGRGEYSGDMPTWRTLGDKAARKLALGTTARPGVQGAGSFVTPAALSLLAPTGWDVEDIDVGVCGPALVEANGPVRVGVMALVVAAMEGCSVVRVLLTSTSGEGAAVMRAGHILA